MILISHRGNLEGKNEKLENHPDYIEEAKKKGFDVEIDVWFIKNNFFLGHDEPQFRVDSKFLEDQKLWCHSKNSDALKELSKLNCHFFWHNTDDYTITSKGYFWTYPGKEILENSICVLPEINNFKIKRCVGICSDNISLYKEKWQK